ncbi:MAG: terpene cyclase/mutase family protein [Thermoguttaceae bacterium]|nr:terpene cyclase/mutase family protein [Thermoguttaceae bacterium]
MADKVPPARQTVPPRVRPSGAARDEAPILSDDAGKLSANTRASSWLFSVATHCAVAVVLALLLLPAPKRAAEIEAIFSTEIGDQLDIFTEDEGSLNPNDAENYALTVPEELKIEDFIAYEPEELPFEDNVASPFFEQSRIETSELLDGRADPGTKNDLIAKYGGNKSTKDAVAAGLRWLAKQQKSDGSWSLSGPYRDGVRLDNPVAATALALLAFQGDGSTRKSGEYAKNVERGWAWLSRRQQKDGSFRAEAPTHANSLFYAHALSTLAICEIVALEKKTDLKFQTIARHAVGFLIENQNEKLGGWRYEPQIDSDLSVTCWCLMALQTARVAKIEVPAKSLERISQFLDSVQYDDGARYAYQAQGKKLLEKRASMTAAGLMCREYLGWRPNVEALQRGAEYLASAEVFTELIPPLEKPKSEGASGSRQRTDGREDWEADESDVEKLQFGNAYGWYAVSTALKQLGPYNKHWRAWNARMSRELPTRQEPKDSKEAGSWPPQNDMFGTSGGGRLYVTAMAILSLESYYRHLALYE